MNDQLKAIVNYAAHASVTITPHQSNDGNNSDKFFFEITVLDQGMEVAGEERNLVHFDVVGNWEFDALMLALGEVVDQHRAERKEQRRQHEFTKTYNL